MADFDENLLGELLIESREHLDGIEPDLLSLEQNPDVADDEMINRIFRAVHSMKGGFGFFGLSNITELAHSMENVLGKVRDGAMKIDSAMVDALLAGVDKLRVLIDDVNNSQTIATDDEKQVFEAILAGQASNAPSAEKAAPAATPPQDQSPYTRALELLNTPGSKRLPEEPTQELGALLETIKATLSDADQMAIIDDAMNDYKICTGSPIGLDGLLREVIREKLEKVTPPEQAAPAPESAPMPAEPEADVKPTAAPAPKESNAPAAKASDAGQSLRVRVDLLDRLVNLASELVLGRNQLKQVLNAKLSKTFTGNKQLEQLQARIGLARNRFKEQIDASGESRDRSFGYLVDNEFNEITALIGQLLDQTSGDLPGFSKASQNIDHVTSELQANIMSTRMQPVGNVLSKFPRVIRDMNKKLGKQIDLFIEGEGVELDKSIIEALGDPLTHLIRNSADHGVETPQVRKAAGKPERGRIDLIARHEAGQVIIEIIDDGAGIDPEKLKAKALEKGVISEQQAAALSEPEALQLIFAPGFSTAEKVSDVSGRGVGMDVVRSNIEKIGGTIELESTLGEGTRLGMKLPLTLAIMPALVFRHQERTFAIPQVDIEELVRVHPQDSGAQIESVKGSPVIRLREELLPLVSLSETLKLNQQYFDQDGQPQADRRQSVLDRRATDLLEDTPEEQPDEERRGRALADRRRSASSAINIIVLKVGSHRFGLTVDKLLDCEEIVVKPLPGYFEGCLYYGGTTIMGDGAVAMILDATGIAKHVGLHFGGDLKAAHDKQLAEEAENELKEKQSFLTVRNGTEERFAISLPMIARIEKAATSDFESIGGKLFINRDNTSLQLVYLHETLPVSKPEQFPEECYILIPKLVRHPIGIVVSKFEEIIETSRQCDESVFNAKGILGSTVIDDQMLIFLDLYGLFEVVAPEIYCVDESELALKGKRILLAEDTEFFQKVELQYLESLGCQVTLVGDGEAAWQQLMENKYDMLITDICMPRLDGMELTKRVRAHENLAGLPVIALTSLLADGDRKRIEESGVDAYESKLDKERLCNTMTELIKA